MILRTKERNKKHIAINTHLILVLILFLVFICSSIASALANEIGLAIGFGIGTALPIFVFIISPLYFVFDDNEVMIVYNFKQKLIIPWESIRGISLMGHWIGAGGGLPHYIIAFPQKEKRAFFVNGEIPKTRRTKKLIKLYYKKNIV